MPTLAKNHVKSEKELHEIIIKEIEALEEGLVVLKHEFEMGKGSVDILCVDSGGRLGIIEVKLGEDENILFQALKYYDWIDKNRYAIKNMFLRSEINPDEHPRLILIATAFSDDIRSLSNLVIPNVELFEYTVLSTSNGKRGIYFHPVSLPKIIDVPPKPPKIDDLLNYITDDSLKERCSKSIGTIEGIGDGIEHYPTQSYIGFKYKGRQFAWLGVQRKSFDFGANIIDENKRLLGYDKIRIEKVYEDYTDILNKIKTSFKNIGGTLKEELGKDR